MEKKRITYAEELNHGDVIRVFSYEQNCGMDETIFTALVAACSDKKKLVIPQDFQGHLYRAAQKGASWEITVDWLLMLTYSLSNDLTSYSLPFGII